MTYYYFSFKPGMKNRDMVDHASPNGTGTALKKVRHPSPIYRNQHHRLLIAALHAEMGPTGI